MPRSAAQSSPLRVLQVSRVYWPNLGGIEKIAQGLAEHLVQRGHTCDVVTLNRSFEDGSSFPAYDLHNGVHVYRVPYWGSNRYPIAPRAIRFAHRYDLVHVHAVDFLVDAMVATRPWHGRPVVLSTHGGFFHTDFLNLLKKAWFQTATRMTLHGVERILCSSEHDYELFSAISDRCSLARNAVDLGAYVAMQNKPRDGYWITVGRVDSHKGIEALLHTLAVVRERDPRGFQLDVIGPEVVPGLVAHLEAKARQLGLSDRVCFRGKVPLEDLHEAVRTAELGLFPSEYEAFGISVVEAMGAGVVPVLNDIGAFRSFIEPGKNGFITKFDRPEIAADVLIEARNLGRRRKQVSKEARRRAEEYSWETTVTRFEELYTEVLQGTSRG